MNNLIHKDKIIMSLITFFSFILFLIPFISFGQENNVTLSSCSGEITSGCYTLLEPLGNIEGITIGSNAAGYSGIGGFINFLFQIGIGIAGILGVVMLIIYGFQYMSNEQSIKNFTELKEKITNVILGLLLLLGTFVLLSTINPDLLMIDPRIKGVSLEFDGRIIDEATKENITTTGFVTINTNDPIYNHDVFLGYLAHQQGVGGAPSIIWAAKHGYTKIPNTTPYITKGGASIINDRMKGNVGSDFTKVTGSNQITPANFLKYWASKIAYLNQNTAELDRTISSEVAVALTNASKTTGVSLQNYKVFCYIESKCKPNAVSGGGKGSYKGLFQMGEKEFSDNGGRGNIFDPYQNAVAAGNYLKKNLITLRNYITTMK